MLDISNLRSKLKRLSKNLKKKTIIITTASLIALTSFFNSAAMAKLNPDSKAKLKEAISLIKKEKERLYVTNELKFKAQITELLKSITKDVESDIEEKKFFESIQTLKDLANLLEFFNMREEAKEIHNLLYKIDSSFYAHVDFNREGVFVVKGNNYIFAILQNPNRKKDQPEKVSSILVNALLSDVGKVGKVFSDLIQSTAFYHEDDKGNTWALVEIPKATIIVKDINGKVIIELNTKDIIKVLEAKKQYLPLK